MHDPWYVKEGKTGALKINLDKTKSAAELVKPGKTYALGAVQASSTRGNEEIMLENKNILVTGAGSGIGETTCWRRVRRICVDLTDGAETTAARIMNRGAAQGQPMC